MDYATRIIDIKFTSAQLYFLPDLNLLSTLSVWKWANFFLIVKFNQYFRLKHVLEKD